MPLTYIDDLTFGALIDALKGIDAFNDEERDQKITETLLAIGGIWPASYSATLDADQKKALIARILAERIQ